MLKQHKIQKNNSQNYIVLFLILVLLIEFAGWIYVNFFRIYKYTVDNDVTKLMYHTIQMWENKTFLIPNWNYMTTGEWDCSSLPALLIYGICGNIYLSFGISNILNLILYGIIIYGLFKLLNIDKVFAFLAISVIWLPFDWGQFAYSNMLFYMGGQYVYKVLLPVWMIFIYLQLELNQNRKATTVSIIGFLILIAATGTSSGVYVLLCGLLPVLICRFIRFYVVADRSSPKMTLKTIIKKKTFIFSIILIVSYLLTLLARIFWNISSRADSMTIRTVSKAAEGFIGNFISFTEVMKLFPNDEITVISFEGIQFILKIALFIIIIRFSLNSFRHFLNLDLTCFSEKDSKNTDTTFTLPPVENSALLRNECKAELITIFIWNYLILQFTSDYSRYHLIGFIPLVLNAFMVLGESNAINAYSKSKSKFIVYLSLLLLATSVVLWLNAGTLLPVEYDSLMQISEIAEENNVESVIFLHDSGRTEQIRLYDTSKQYLTFNCADNSLVVYDYYKDQTERASINNLNIVVVTDDEQFEDLPEYIRNTYRPLAKIEDLYDLYISDICRMDSIAGLDFGLNQAIDYAYTPGYLSCGTIQSDGGLVIKESDYLLSPYLKSTETGYKMTLCFNDITGNSSGELEIIDSSENLLSSYNIKEADRNLTIEIPANTEIMYKLIPSDNASLYFTQTIFDANC